MAGHASSSDKHAAERRRKLAKSQVKAFASRNRFARKSGA
jgi:hypothetical protein